MNAKEKTYMMALAALLLIGLSTAWAGYNATVTISSSGTIYDFASVSPVSSPTLSNLKKGTWFKTSEQSIFKINNVNVTSIFVRVTLLNMPDLVGDFRSLDINVTLYDASNSLKDSGVISLETGAASVLLYADGLSTPANLTVKATIYGYTSSKVGSSSVKLTFVCTVEPAAFLSLFGGGWFEVW
jgi:hypothetical protein